MGFYISNSLLLKYILSTETYRQIKKVMSYTWILILFKHIHTVYRKHMHTVLLNLKTLVNTFAPIVN